MDTTDRALDGLRRRHRRSVRRKQILLVVGACVLAAYLPWAVNFGSEVGSVHIAPGTPDLFTFAGSSFLAGGIFGFIGWAFLVYTCFESSLAWGIGNLLFFPVGIVFMFKHPLRSRDAIFFLILAGVFHAVSALFSSAA